MVLLDVHLESHHTLYFRERQKDQAVSRSITSTTLAKRFIAIQKRPGTSISTTPIFCANLTCNKSSMSWAPSATLCFLQSDLSVGTRLPENVHVFDFDREEENVFECMYTVSSRESERHYSGAFLLLVVGAASFQDRQPVKGEASTG